VEPDHPVDGYGLSMSLLNAAGAIYFLVYGWYLGNVGTVLWVRKFSVFIQKQKPFDLRSSELINDIDLKEYKLNFGFALFNSSQAS
jgi:hypothetical protein